MNRPAVTTRIAIIPLMLIFLFAFSLAENVQAESSKVQPSQNQKATGRSSKDRPSKTGKPEVAEEIRGDSVQALKFILEKEFKRKRRVYRLKKPEVADSLLRDSTVPTVPQLRNLLGDSAQAEEILTQLRFRDYWSEVEARYGISGMKAQYDARDPDRSRVPKIYLADSSIVILPGWIVVRKR